MKKSVLLTIALALSAATGCASPDRRPDPDADADRDGVLDALDHCPATPSGTVVNMLGCAFPQGQPIVDSDGDGVADAQDSCPKSVAGTLIDLKGCTATVPAWPDDTADTDSDGVADSLDLCADTPSGMKVNSQGCVLSSQTLVLRNITFALNSSELTETSYSVLDVIVAGLNGQPAMRLQVVGHTDNVGPDRYNLRLSQARAAAVAAYLVEHGVAADRLSSAGEGEGQPVADNATDEGRALNRRVEFKVE